MIEYYILFFIIVFIIIFVFRYYIFLKISNILSLFFCNNSDIDNFRLCKNIYINNYDNSAPSNSMRSGLLWEVWMNKFIKQHADYNKCALDIGAHIGIHTINLSKSFKYVYSFEPNPEIFYNLKLNTKNLKNVKIYNNAIGDKEKNVNLILQNLTCQNYIDDTISNNKNKLIVKQLKLDNIYFPCQVGFIKIDIEGGEINAFKGMFNIIKNDNPVIVYEDHKGDNTNYLIKTHHYKIKKINATNFIAFK